MVNKYGNRVAFFIIKGITISRTLKAAGASFFLLGPRGTGKSTWAKAAFPNALRVDLLKESTFVELTRHADRLESMADADRASTIVIDEVQISSPSVPSLGSEPVSRKSPARYYRA